MSEPLDELRAQRALIQQHLDWLDARIAEADEAPAAAASGEPDENSPADATPAQLTKQPDEPDAAPPASPFFDIDNEAHSSTGSDIRKAQIGCFIVFLVAILGFLFLLFGLPYLVD